MRIISCHIDNFGKLSNYTENFSAGIHSICQNNGWGKSTFAAFIRAMFYGLEGDRKRNIEANERKRYKPWQDGVFGGSLTFEIQDKRYVISRVFKDKEANDEFELRDADTNLISDDYTENIGCEIFRIDRESFIRTIFIGQNECATSTTDDINAKIGNLTENANDINYYENANAKLTEYINALNPRRATGSISKRKKEIADLERKVQDGRGIADSLEKIQNKIAIERQNKEDTKKKWNEAVALQKKVTFFQSANAKEEEWLRLKKKVEEKTQEAKEKKSYFPKDVPDMEDVKDNIRYCQEWCTQKKKAESYLLQETEKENLLYLQDRFGEYIPEQSVIDQKIKEATEYRNLCQKQSQEQLSVSEKERMKELNIFFEDEDNQATVMLRKWEERKDRKREIDSKKIRLEEEREKQEENKKQEKKYRKWLFAGVACMLAGVIAAICMAPLRVVGIVILLLGLLSCKMGVSVKKETEKDMQKTIDIIGQLQNEIEKEDIFVKQKEQEVRQYLAKHGYAFCEDSVYDNLQSVLKDSVEYHTLKKKSQDALDSNLLKDINARKKEMMDFFEEYGIPVSGNEYVEVLYDWKEKIRMYEQLLKKETMFQEMEKANAQKEKQLMQFIESFGWNALENMAAQLEEIREKTIQYQHATQNADEAKQELQKFEEETDMDLLKQDSAKTELPTAEEVNEIIKNLSEEKECIQKTILDYQRTQNELQEKYEDWEEEQALLENLKSRQEEEKKKYQYLQMVQKKLSGAKEAITSKYAAPILKSFRTYYHMIAQEDTKKFHLDANINITVDEWGRQRTVNTLSNGYQDLIQVCLRVALVDAMYQEESPILILDDPFANLDDEKLKMVKDFLDIVAQKYQIIYFTCSHARE